MNYKKSTRAIALCMALAHATFILSITLNLTDTLNRTSTGFPIDPSISPNGSLAYLVYEIDVTPSTTLAAELFMNNNGTLQSLIQVSADATSNFDSIDDGFANQDFTQFSLIDDTSSSGTTPAQIRIRLFDPIFSSAISRTFDNFDPGPNAPASPAYSGAGGTFSDDGTLVAMSYLTDSTVTPQQSILHVLSTIDLSTVASIPFDGGSNGPFFFSLNKNGTKRTFITLTSFENFTFAFGDPTATAPSLLYVFELVGSTLNLVDTAFLPQASLSGPTVSMCGEQALIGIGTNLAVIAPEESLFVSPTSSFINTDNRELRFYTFDGSNLELQTAQSTGITTYSPVFYPLSSLVLVNQQALDGQPSFFNLFKKHKTHLELEERTHLSAPFFSGAFSDNGKWLLVTGSDENSALFDVALYRVCK